MSNFSNNADKPVIGISIGDYNGIGPEVILKTVLDTRILKICIPVIYGSAKIFSRYRKLLELDEFNFHLTRTPEGINQKKINLITCWEEDFEIQPGKITAEAGTAALLSLKKVADDAIAHKIDAMVTAPINKKNIQSDSFEFPGHTEFLTSLSNAPDSLMLLVSDKLRIGVVTGHIALKEVASQLTKEKILAKINVLYKSLKNDFGILKPKIALLGLNPHAGEDGLLGSEEKEILTPLIEDIKSKGILVFGPFSADGFFGNGGYNKFDGVLAMYHDQGLIPFKTLAFDSGVNFTAGLPIIRTSPDHGTAYDIAGKNLAQENSFREALYLAADLVKSRKLVNA